MLRKWVALGVAAWLLPACSPESDDGGEPVERSVEAPPEVPGTPRTPGVSAQPIVRPDLPAGQVPGTVQATAARPDIALRPAGWRPALRSELDRPVPERPAPIRGGSLAIDDSGRYAVIGDADQHRVFIVDMAPEAERQVKAIALGAEPGRIAVQGSQAVVVLRDGAVVLLDLIERTEVGRVSVCAAPRGIAWAGDRIHVACAGGELVELGADGIEVGRLHLEPDLRDVVVKRNRRYVSVFRSAEVLVIEGDQIVDRWSPEPLGAGRMPNLAWQLHMTPEGQLAMVHQDAEAEPIDLDPEDDPADPRGGSASLPYGTPEDPCPEGPRTTAVSVFASNGFPQPAAVLPRMVLGVDFVPLSNGKFVVADGGRPQMAIEATITGQRCAVVPNNGAPVEGLGLPDHEIVSVAAGPDEVVYGVTRQPLALLRLEGGFWRPVAQLGAGLSDPGHQLFHRGASGNIACASCHPEGSQDGHTWHFEGIGQRRTQDLRGGLRGSEPFHWDQDQTDFTVLMDEVFVRRMGGTEVTRDQAEALLTWLDALPVEPITSELSEAAVRGQAVFERADVACTACHSGARLTNQGEADVGTGKSFAVPSLRGLALRAPFMHNGCALTLRDRFDPDCGGGDAHGVTSHLSDLELDDLVAYLETL